MVAHKLLAVALAATLLLGGVAATGAAAPQIAQTDSQPDDPGAGDAPDNSTQYEDGADEDAENDSEDAERGPPADRGNDSAAERGNAPDDVGPDGEQGPPTDLPEQVPDHVHEIHDTIRSYLSGDVDNLGHALSDLLGGEDGEAADAGEEEADEESEDADSDADDDSDAADDSDADDSSDDSDDTEDSDE